LFNKPKPLSIQLNIDKPCHENWDNMQPNTDGRHCMSCQKTVVDFSNMTDREILDYISNISGDICGRADRMQLNRNLRENNLRKRFSWRYIWNLIIVVFVFAGKAKAQGGIRFQKVAQLKKDRPEDEICLIRKPIFITGTVKNAMTGEPIPFASVLIKGTQNGVSTDSAGKFRLEITEIGRGADLEVSSTGFESGSVNIKDSDKGEQIIHLSPAAQELDKVEIVGFPVIRCSSVMGGLFRNVNVCTIEKVTRELKELFPQKQWLGTKDIVVFPNPIDAGNNVQVALQLKEAGQYRVDLIDASGKVLWMQTLNMKEPAYKVSIPTNTTWSAGVYWLRITGRHTKKIYTGKIVLQ
jgi:hypothetical protein